MDFEHQSNYTSMNIIKTKQGVMRQPKASEVLLSHVQLLRIRNKTPSNVLRKLSLSCMFKSRRIGSSSCQSSSESIVGGMVSSDQICYLPESILFFIIFCWRTRIICLVLFLV